jgi:small subunit ribosomal protein S6
MNQYEGMFLVKGSLDEKNTNSIFDQIREIITKDGGKIISSRVWAEKQKLSFPIKKIQEATYYLVNFNLDPGLIEKIRQAYRLNANILRVLIIRQEDSS